MPCVMMRDGASRGASLLVECLPEDQTQRGKILMAIMGFSNGPGIDDINGGNPLINKVAVISRSSDPCAGIGYLFTQIIVHEQHADTTPGYSNMLSGIRAFAIEDGLITTTSPVTRTRTRNVSTGTFVEADMQTPSSVVEYEGSARIDGVPGAATPVTLTFLNAAGTRAGKIFPTDNRVNYLGDVPVTCINMAMSAVIIPAKYLGKTGYELPAELDADKVLLAHIESIRLQTGKAMGLGDTSDIAIPKPVLISPAQKGRIVNVRYFMPHSCHHTLTITGAIAISSSYILEGTVTRQIVPSVGYDNINIGHPSGALDVYLSNKGQDATTLHTLITRITRKISPGEVCLP